MIDRPDLSGHRRRTLTTRTRILEAARQELGRDPESSLGDIAEAAGVARRTVYGHLAAGPRSSRGSWRTRRRRCGTRSTGSRCRYRTRSPPWRASC
ncbi:TetR family transcriptional regulator [Streptomyces diastatochromogenes]|nr:TetR family transcriptional regulator [Streptomyces diastatochromogenes]